MANTLNYRVGEDAVNEVLERTKNISMLDNSPPVNLEISSKDGVIIVEKMDGSVRDDLESLGFEVEGAETSGFDLDYFLNDETFQTVGDIDELSQLSEDSSIGIGPDFG